MTAEGRMAPDSSRPHGLNNLQATAEFLDARKYTAQDDPTLPMSPGDEALESHEVIGLQAFSERKVWIEEKIKFLGQMPPVEVFVGLDAIHDSALEVPGLPSREELQQWLVEHDKIEKETEIFDSGELRKLKKFTKAATQRNLSPADTDLIEITLTTIYELDKLLHLLRDRSDSLDLLGVRLTWEERRKAAWSELSSILVDLQDFLDTRARWSPAVYSVDKDELEQNSFDAPTPSTSRSRRGSVVSLASVASETSLGSAGYSRRERFKLAEMLSKDAAQFASRVSSLRHIKIGAAAKALDKLIDSSRRPVPDVLLDEQDKLEDKGINEMEDIGKFVMNVVMQWKKADEIYVETLKDASAGQTLIEEIETAKLHHPTSRQDSAFLTRVSALTKRLLMRGNLFAPNNSFIRPHHHLFPDQRKSNENIAYILASELASASEHVKRADTLAKEYHANYEAVKRVENACKAASDLSGEIDTLISRLNNGIMADSGVPPDLTSETCLHSSSHSVYLSLLPSLIEEVQRADESASNLLQTAQIALLDVERPGIDPQFVTDSVTEVERLISQQTALRQAKQVVESHTETLSLVRKVWSSMAEIFNELQTLREDTTNAIAKCAWKHHVQENTAPLTPESPTVVLPSADFSLEEACAKYSMLESRLQSHIIGPLSSLSSSLGPDLQSYLSACSTGLSTTLAETKGLMDLLFSIRKQARDMLVAQDSIHAFQVDIDELALQFDSTINGIIDGSLDGAELTRTEDALTVKARGLQAKVQTFVGELPRKIPFVAQSDGAALPRPLTKHRYSSSRAIEFSLEVVQQGFSEELPIDPIALDSTVRKTSNSYSIALAGGLESLSRKIDCLRLARLARTLDVAAASLADSLQEVVAAFEALQQLVDEASAHPTSLDDLDMLLGKVDALHCQREPDLVDASGSLHNLLVQLEAGLSSHDLATIDFMLRSRKGDTENTQQQLRTWKEGMKGLTKRIAHLRDLERARLAEEARAIAEQERLEVEAAAKAERARHEAETERIRSEAEAQRKADIERMEAEAREKERLEKEARERVEREARENAEREAREQVEREKEEREAKERREREAQEKAELEEKEREEKERLEAEAKEKAEQERLELEERERLEAKRLDMVEKARLEAEAERKRLVDEEVLRRLGERKEHHNATVPALLPGFQDDVFSLPTKPDKTKDQARFELRNCISNLRKRIRSLGLNEVIRPSPRGMQSLPDNALFTKLKAQLFEIVNETNTLPSTVLEDSSIDTELRSLRSDLQASEGLLEVIERLASLENAVRDCDNALSDLLEHIDSYPSPPLGILSSSHSSDTSLPPEEQLDARLTFTRELLDTMTSRFTLAARDSRAISERDRILQTWDELQSMSLDRISGQKSRPGSVISISGRSSRNSIGPPPVGTSKKAAAYSSLSAAGPGGKYLAPPPLHGRRTASSTRDAHSRSSSRASVTSSNRSVSGPAPIVPLPPPPFTLKPTVPITSSRLFQSTFASRQRTSSVSSIGPPITATQHKHPEGPSSTSTTHRPRARALTNQSRTGSPTLSEVSSISMNRSNRSSMSRSTWARAPRQSFPNIPMSPLPRSQDGAKKPYVPNAKNKLDVAVGEVINSLPVDIKVEVVAETWKDQSGKYWIGNEEPKLCFCRILRSQAVMVRVGGGWSELSKFIKEHFADAFRVLPLPESPPRGREEKWISSAALTQTMQSPDTPPFPPRTPEPKSPPFLPAFALSTPNGASPRSIKSASPGSPLHPIQFIRRAERDPSVLRPETPTRAPRPSSVAHHIPKQPTWRP